jgi:hypothetical protein
LVAADDDWEALGRMVDLMGDYEVVSIHSWPKLEDAVAKFEPELVLMADTLHYPRVSAKRMVECLFRDYDSRIIVLSEFVSPEIAAKWRERGAVDCVLHPTKVRGRMMALLKGVFNFVHGEKRIPKEEDGRN